MPQERKNVWPLLMEPYDHLQDGIQIHEMFHIPPSKKKKEGVAVRRCRIYSTHKKRAMLCVEYVPCRTFVLANATGRKTAKQIHKHLR